MEGVTRPGWLSVSYLDDSLSYYADFTHFSVSELNLIRNLFCFSLCPLPLRLGSHLYASLLRGLGTFLDLCSLGLYP